MTFSHQLNIAIERILGPGPEAGLANTLSKELGTNYHNMPSLSRPQDMTATDREPIKKSGGVPKKRSHRKFLGTNNEPPGV